MTEASGKARPGKAASKAASKTPGKPAAKPTTKGGSKPAAKPASKPTSAPAALSLKSLQARVDALASEVARREAGPSDDGGLDKTVAALGKRLDGLEVMVRRRLDELFADALAAAKERRSLGGRLQRSAADVAKLRAGVVEVRELIRGDLLARALSDSETIHELYQAALVRVTVATEARFIARVSATDKALSERMSAAAVAAFDLPDWWWQSRAAWTMGAWMQELARIADEGLPNVDKDPPRGSVAIGAEDEPQIAPEWRDRVIHLGAVVAEDEEDGEEQDQAWAGELQADMDEEAAA